MRTQYLLDDVRRRAGAALRRLLAQKEQAERERRLRLAWAVAALLVAGGVAWASWRVAFAPPAVLPPAAQASVPAHQRSGPLANPWGDGPPTVAERAAADAASSSAGSGPTGPAEVAAPRAAAGSPSLDTPAAREALRAALAQLRSSARAADYASLALQGGEPAALVVVWMAQRQCREVAQWRQIAAWRERAAGAARGETPGFAPIPGANTLMRSVIERCDGLPEESAIDDALAAAGFVPNAALHETARRPLDLALAAALGDATLLAMVLDASTAEEITAWVGARTNVAPQAQADLLRGALWLAACLNAEAAGVNARRAACQEHPALWQACIGQGLCDVRDLHDLMLRTMPADEMHLSGRLARALAPHLGRQPPPRSQR